MVGTHLKRNDRDLWD